MKRVLLACLAAAFVASARGDDAYPPAGYVRAITEPCVAGHFVLVGYSKEPWDFDTESQLWVEYDDPKIKPQLLFSFLNRAQQYIDDAGDHIAIEHHEGSGDNLLYLFVRGADHRFHRVPQELRAAALQEFNRQAHTKVTREDFDHFDCYADEWLKGGLLRGYIRGDSQGKKVNSLLAPWYFIYDAEHQKFVAHDFPENKDALVREPR